MNYKIIAIDLDGTLLNDNVEILPENKIAIQKAVEKGVHIIISSGRGYKSINNFVKELEIKDLDFYGSAFHGSCVFKISTMEKIKEFYIDRNIILNIYDEIKNSDDIGVIIYKDGDNFYTMNKNSYVDMYYEKIKYPIKIINSYNDISGDFVKMLFIGNNENLIKYYNKFKYLDEKNICKVFFSASYLLEFMNPFASKGDSLKFICNKLGIDISESIGIGDNYNDIELIRDAGLGVAMKNGVDEAKYIANYVTNNDNNNCGVAEVINKFILNS